MGPPAEVDHSTAAHTQPHQFSACRITGGGTPASHPATLSHPSGTHKRLCFFDGPPHTQIKAESFVEDINNLLNSGEVPNMFPYDERAAVLEQCRTLSKKEGLALDSAVGALLFTCFMPSCVVGVGCPLVCWGVLCGSPYGSASDFSGSRHSSSAVALMHQA